MTETRIDSQPAAAPGAGRRRVAIDDILRIQPLSSPTVSPCGQRALVVVQRCDRKQNKYFKNLLLVDLGGDSLRPFTVGDQKDTSPAWSPDGSTVAFVSDRTGKQQIYLIRTDGGEATALTDVEKGSISGLRWSPDGRRLLFIYHRKPRPVLEKTVPETPPLEGDGGARDGGAHDDGAGEEEKRPPLVRVIDRIRYRFDGRGYLDEERDQIWTADLPEGRLTQLTSGPHDCAMPCWSPDGQSIAFVSNRSEDPDLTLGEDELWIQPATGGELRHLPSIVGPKVGLAWTPDGRSLCFVGHTDPTDWGIVSYHPWLVPVDGGEVRNLCPGADQTAMALAVDDLTPAETLADHPIWSADGSRIILSFADRGSIRIFAVPVAGGELEPLTPGEELIRSVIATPDRRRLVFLRARLAEVPEVHTLDLGEDGTRRESAGLRRASKVNDDHLAGVAIEPPEVVEIRSSGGPIQGFLHRPPDFDPKRKYPALLEVHGGPHAFYTFSFFHEMSWLAACGYVVLATNPRGSSSFGEAFAGAIRNNWGGPDYEDVLAAADYLADLEFVDGDRMGILGGSYGGWMTNWVVGHTDRFKAAVTMRSVSSMVSMFGASDVGYDMRHEFGGLLWEARDDYERQSPFLWAHRIKTPTLIIHSEQDLRCPMNQGQELYAVLKLRKVPTRLVLYPEESHDLSRGGRPDRRIDRLERIRDWMDRYLM